MDVNRILSDYFCKSYNIKESNYIIETINAKELFVPERIDLISKYKYIEYREKGYSLSYAKELYGEHIAAFSSGKFTEPGQEETKNSLAVYFNVFDELIECIKSKGFDSNISVVPVGKGDIIIDGSHRTAIAAYYDIPLPIIRFDIRATSYSANYFAEKLLPSDYLDYMVTEYCKLKNNVYMAILWPKVFTKIEVADIEKIIGDLCKTVYKKELNFSFDSLTKLMTQVYHQEKWLGNIENRFQGAKSKALECYDKNEKLIVYILESDDAANVLNIKQQIRSIAGISNSAIHTTDTAIETARLCKTLLNKNSIHLLNFGNPCAFPKAHAMFDRFKNNLHAHNMNADEFIIDSSGVLGLYGLRDIGDLDFLSISKNCVIIEDEIIHNNHEKLPYYTKTTDELLYNPNYYLDYNNIKFITLETLRHMKKNKDESKDKIDVALINSFLQKNKDIKQIILLFIQKKKVGIIRKWRNFNGALKNGIIKMLKIIGIYPLVRWLYRKIKRR